MPLFSSRQRPVGVKRTLINRQFRDYFNKSTPNKFHILETNTPPIGKPPAGLKLQ